MTGVTMEEGLARVDALDLEPIIFKLVHPEPGETGMRLEEADELVKLYRYFLKLNVLYPAKSIVPSKRLDAVWHTHILDTAKYHEDCIAVFGRILHHFPYLGLRGKEDVQNWQQSYKETCELFQAHFGVDLSSNAAACGDSGDAGDLCDGGSCDSGSCNASDSLSRERPRINRELVGA